MWASPLRQVLRHALQRPGGQPVPQDAPAPQEEAGTGLLSQTHPFLDTPVGFETGPGSQVLGRLEATTD